MVAPSVRRIGKRPGSQGWPASLHSRPNRRKPRISQNSISAATSASIAWAERALAAGGVGTPATAV
jgi:hypothetical protein